MTVTSYDTKDDPLLRRLDEIAVQSPSLTPVARLYGAVLPLLRKEAPCAVPVIITQDAAQAKLKEGRHLLHDLDVELDIPAIAELLIRLAAAVEKSGEDVKADRLRAWIGDHQEDFGFAMQDVLVTGGHPLADAVERMGMDAAVFRTLAQTALKPTLRAWSGKLAPLAAGIPWNRGTCFVCGSFPVFGELQGNAQTLHLRCGSCGADWEHPRLTCVFCGNDDHRTRNYLFRVGEHRNAHVEACDRCKRYLKIIPAFSPAHTDMLPVEDLATLDLDHIAVERGYTRSSSDS
ncbi:MAG TPA: formate dehydrogenase accessory protein FdhE [Nitrospirota bacterium]|nr:formate dehydrogenase accessory protein FdhE [Nitrospirota bacterium]